MIYVLEHQRAAILKQNPRQGLLVAGKTALVRRLVLTNELVGLGLVLFDGEIAFGSQAHDAGGKSLLVKRHAFEEAHGRRRHIVWRFVQRNNGSVLWVPTKHAPDHQVVKKDHDHAGESEDGGFIVSDKPGAFLFGCGFRNQALRPGDHDRELLMGGKVVSLK